MAITIVLDAGHGGTRDPGAVYQGRQEKNDNLALVLAVGRILTQNGINVVYTRTTDVYDSPTRKAQIANESGADYFVSFHRNASPNANTYSGVQTLIYDQGGIKEDMANAVNAALADVGYRNLGISIRPDLAVLRRTQMPAILIETGFINTDADNTLYDTRFNETAQAIADGILNAVGGEGGERTYYSVQVGAFQEQDNAARLEQRLSDQGFPAFIRVEDGSWKVLVGAFAYLENAVKMEQRLREAGYSTYINSGS